MIVFWWFVVVLWTKKTNFETDPRDIQLTLQVSKSAIQGDHWIVYAKRFHSQVILTYIHVVFTHQGIIYLNIIIYLFTLEILNNNIWNHWLNFVLFILSNNSKMANEYKNQFNSLLSYSFSLFVKNRWFIHRNLTIFRYSWNPLCFINKTTSSS